MEITENSKTLKFDANGLIPAIVQDHYTKEVLTLPRTPENRHHERRIPIRWG